MRQEIDGLHDRHLQLASYLHFLRQEIGTTSLLFTLPEAGDRWAPGQTFTTSHLSILQDRNNSRHKADNWYLYSVHLLNYGNDRIRRGAEEPCLEERTKRSRTPHSRGQGDPQLHMHRDPLGQKGRGCQAMRSLDNMLCSGIHLGQKMRMRMGGGPGSGQV